MYLHLYLTVLTVLWAFSNAAKRTKETTKDEDYEIICSPSVFGEFDAVITRIVSFTEKQRLFPDDKSKLRSYCQETKKDERSLDSYAKTCLKGVTKNFAQVLIYSFGATIKTYCNPRNKKKQDELVSMAKCMNTKNIQYKSKELLNDFKEALKHGAIANPAKNRIGYACCNYFRLLNGLESKLTGICTPKQTRSVTDFIRNLIQSLIDVACLDFTDASDVCDKLPPPPKDKYPSIIPNSTSFVVPLLELFANNEK